jgi:predicted enzyme related to lactoylglutathione lyase
MIELLDFQSHRSPRSERTIYDIGPTHLALQVASIDNMVGQFCDHGIELLAKPAVSVDGKAKVAFCRAPEGTYIEIVELL